MTSLLKYLWLKPLMAGIVDSRSRMTSTRISSVFFCGNTWTRSVVSENHAGRKHHWNAHAESTAKNSWVVVLVDASFDVSTSNGPGDCGHEAA